MAAQLIAAHNAAMECYRRAMIDEQTFEGRRENLAQANKLSRTFATLLEALNRHRGKGQQKMTVEHVYVHSGGAVVGVSSLRVAGIPRNWRINHMPGKLPMHLSRRCGARTRRGTPCQQAAMANSRCRMHGGTNPGAPKGKVIGTLSSMAATLPRRLPTAARWQRLFVPCVLWPAVPRRRASTAPWLISDNRNSRY
jgi:hypothetical protein